MNEQDGDDMARKSESQGEAGGPYGLSQDDLDAIRAEILGQLRDEFRGDLQRLEAGVQSLSGYDLIASAVGGVDGRLQSIEAQLQPLKKMRESSERLAKQLEPLKTLIPDTNALTLPSATAQQVMQLRAVLKRPNWDLVDQGLAAERMEEENRQLAERAAADQAAAAELEAADRLTRQLELEELIARVAAEVLRSAGARRPASSR